MAAAGVPLRQIAGMLGHTEQRTTELYAKHHPDFLQAAASTLETLFGDQQPQPIGQQSYQPTMRQTCAKEVQHALVRIT